MTSNNTASPATQAWAAVGVVLCYSLLIALSNWLAWKGRGDDTDFVFFVTIAIAGGILLWAQFDRKHRRATAQGEGRWLVPGSRAA